MDEEGKKLLENEIESIIQSIPEWAKYISKNDEIRRQITAIYHAVYGYATNGIVAEDCLQKIQSAVAPYDIFSGKCIGWAIHTQDDYSLSFYWDERNRIRSVKKSVLLLLADIDKSNLENKANVYREDLHKVMSERDAIQRKMNGRKKITQEKASEIIGVTARRIRDWEKGKGTPDWYLGRDMTVVEFTQRYRQGTAQKKMQSATKKGLQNPISLDRLKNI